MPENILLLHILKEKNGSVMFKLLDTLMKFVSEKSEESKKKGENYFDNTSSQSCNTLCSLFDNKELDIHLKTYMAKIMLRFC